MREVRLDGEQSKELQDEKLRTEGIKEEDLSIYNHTLTLEEMNKIADKEGYCVKELEKDEGFVLVVKRTQNFYRDINIR